jgi:hypothetical protein
VVYVDLDSVAVAHARMILAGNPHAAVIHADLRHPDLVLAHRDLRSLPDLDQPVALLTVAVLHFVPDTDNPGDIVAAYRQALAAGSHLVISHATSDGQHQAQATEHRQLYTRTATPHDSALTPPDHRPATRLGPARPRPGTPTPVAPRPRR